MTPNRRDLLGALGATSFAGCLSPGRALAQDRLQALHEAARKEGKVVYWGSPDSRTARLLIDAFKRRFPGVDVEVFKIQSAAAIERIIAGAQSGRAEADVVDSILGYLPLLFDRGLAVSHPWTENFGIDPTRVLFDGKALTLWHLDSPVAVNTGVVKAGEVGSWADLLEPKWRGKLLVEARGFAFAILAQKPIITKGGTATIEALSAGQGSLAIGAYAGTVEQFRRDGAPVDWLRFGPVPAAYAVLLQLSNAPHPNAARLWSYFMMSKEAHDANYEGLGLDIVFGRDVGELGKKYVAANLEVVPETTDVARMQALVTRANTMISALR